MVKPAANKADSAASSKLIPCCAPITLPTPFAVKPEPNIAKALAPVS